MFRSIVKREATEAIVAGDDGAVLHLTAQDLATISHALLSCTQVDREDRDHCFERAMSLHELLDPVLIALGRRADAAH